MIFSAKETVNWKMMGGMFPCSLVLLLIEIDKNMKGNFEVQKMFIIGAIVIGFLLNQSNCVSDETCDPDPVYGGCPTSCHSGTLFEWGLKSLGIWFVLNFGSFLRLENMKEKPSLKDFIVKNNLIYTVRQIDSELTEEEKKEKDKK
jgi:hypothetical protein